MNHELKDKINITDNVLLSDHIVLNGIEYVIRFRDTDNIVLSEWSK